MFRRRGDDMVAWVEQNAQHQIQRFGAARGEHDPPIVGDAKQTSDRVTGLGDQTRAFQGTTMTAPPRSPCDFKSGGHGLGDPRGLGPTGRGVIEVRHVVSFRRTEVFGGRGNAP